MFDGGGGGGALRAMGRSLSTNHEGFDAAGSTSPATACSTSSGGGEPFLGGAVCFSSSIASAAATSGGGDEPIMGGGVSFSSSIASAASYDGGSWTVLAKSHKASAAATSWFDCGGGVSFCGSSNDADDFGDEGNLVSGPGI